MAATIEEMSSTTTGTKTVASLARDWALTAPGKVAMREKDFGIWQEYNWAQTWDLIETIGHRFEHRHLYRGVPGGDR